MSAPTPAPTPSSAGTPVLTDALRLVRVLFSPGTVFGEIQERPTFWMPFLVVAIANAGISFLMSPFQQRVGQIMAERAGRPAPTTSVLKTVLSLGFSPLTVLIVCAIVGGILYLLVSMFGGQTSYKKMLTVAIFVWPLSLIQQLVTFAVLTSRGGAGAIAGPQDMFVSLGADLLLPTDTQTSYFVRFLLAGIGPLQLWALAITATGLMVMGKAGKGPAWTAAIIYFVIALLLIATIGSFGMKMMGG
jgi:hypothetical protein